MATLNFSIGDSGGIVLKNGSRARGCIWLDSKPIERKEYGLSIRKLLQNEGIPEYEDWVLTYVTYSPGENKQKVVVLGPSGKSKKTF